MLPFQRSGIVQSDDLCIFLNNYEGLEIIIQFMSEHFELLVCYQLDHPPNGSKHGKKQNWSHWIEGEERTV